MPFQFNFCDFKLSLFQFIFCQFLIFIFLIFIFQNLSLNFLFVSRLFTKLVRMLSEESEGM